MHIAICDDNVADRKQLERLLKRESDKRSASSGILYTDSYGHPESLLKNSMQYDAFFVDICHTGDLTGIDVVNSLTALGNTSPVILCCSEIDYRNTPLPDRVLFLEKPIKPEALSLMLDKAQQIKDAAVPLIELREGKGTSYVTEPDILYGVEEKRHFTVFLANGKKALLETSAQNFFSQVEHYPTFFCPSPHILANARHIKTIGLGRITMSDGASFRIFGRVRSYAKHVWEDVRDGRL